MKIKPIYLIAAVLVLALTVAVWDGLRLRDKYSISIGNYQAAIDSSKTLNAKKDKAIADAQKTITLQIAQINELLGNAGQPSASETEKDKVIAAQQKKIAGYEAQGDLKTALEASKAESRAWAEKFTLAEERHAQDICNLNAAWKVPCDAQVVISDAWKAKYESEAHLRTQAEKGWKSAEGKLRWSRVMGNIKSAAVLASAVYIIFNAIKTKGT